MKVGVLAYQGSFEEHATQTKRALIEAGYEAEIIAVKRTTDLKQVDSIIIPGGESTTIGAIAQRMGVLQELKDRILEGMPVMGTCAGAILLAKESVDSRVREKKQPLLQVMDISVVRNYYGRQRESFQATLDLSSLNLGTIRTVFIRSPAIIKVWGGAREIARLNDAIVMAVEGNMIATTFHPELADVPSVHRYFVEMIKK
jgi:5'-phosphate synthase pdxT subunit